MSLQVAVAHTGQRLEADPVSFNSIDALKAWIAKATQIPPQDQILLTTRSKHVKPQTLLTETEIFVFDRDLFSLSSNLQGNLIQPTPLPEPFTADDPPRNLASDTDLKAWQALFKARRDWALGILQTSQSLSRIAQRYFEDQGVIDRAARIAVGNHDSYIKNLEQKHSEARSWYDDVSKEQEDNVRFWERDFSQLEYLPAKREFLSFISKGTQQAQNGQRTSSQGITLKEYIDYDSAKTASSVSRKTIETFGKRVSTMGSQIEKTASNYQELLGAVDQSQSRSAIDDVGEPLRLLEEIEAVVKKVGSDYEHVLSLTPSPKSVAQVSKMALLHTRNYLPAIQEYSAEMGDLVRRAVEQKNASVANAVDSMRGIAKIENVISTLNDELKKLDFSPEGLEAFEMMSLVSRIPFVYGSLLIEAVRRHEWVEKMKKDSSALAEEMAGFQDEEERRRKRWLKPFQDLVNIEAIQGNMLGFEMNIQGEKQNWPVVSREEVQDYLQSLQTLEGQESSVGPLIQAFKDLDKPTKQQVKRAKNFKAGSVHEGAFGQASLLLRGDDEARVLKEANVKLEEELKGSKSRVRRLEDLLHRQSTLSRLSIGSGFQPQGLQSPAEPSTPNPDRPQDQLSRRSSVSSRRFSSNQGPDEKALARKTLKLEADLAAEKETVATLRKEAQSRNNEDEDLKRQIEDANFTKKDLMENMEAQQKEFATERRSLEDELAKYKLKIEDAEDELDRILGSRDNERTGTDTKIQILGAEMDQLRTEATEAADRAASRIKELESILQTRDHLENQRRTSLVTVYRHLSSDDTEPEDHDHLISQLEDLATRSVTHLQELTQAVAIAKSENQAVRSGAEKTKSELSAKVDASEKERDSLRKQLDIEKAKAVSIKAELEEERGHLEDLRTKFAAGETGSEALRQRVADEESKVEKLSSELAESKSHAISLDVALMSLQKQISKDSETETSRLQHTGARAKEVTRRLYTVNQRLLRLLESFGFLISYEGDSMVVQRASRASASTMLINDPSNSINRGVTTPSPTRLKMHLEDLSDLTFLQWPETDDTAEETQRFTELINTLDQFDMEMFCEAVLKRMRDMEHTARKFQKETRAYREKYHRAQSEAHEKIAFHSFKEGDLALFLPTRNQATRPWAAFNVGAPHYFLREQDSHKLHGREWLVARISKVEPRVVDLSKTMESVRNSSDSRSITSGVSYEDDNPFELSDGLRWYLIDAAEEKAGAPSTPGLGKTTVASAHVDAKGSIRMTKKSGSNDPTKTLNKSLDSRRSSANSRKSAPTAAGRQGSSEAVSLADGGEGSNANPAANPAAALGTSPNSNSGPGPSHPRTHAENGASSSSTFAQPPPSTSRVQDADEVRKDLLWGP
ncbi:uncharacterized protein BDZ99DRAFT_379763 [Mytilinidion resinicola]|uniref:Autophagy-related protein 11 n=1 Tax=Mytilinidion resinicola TaxID=574789 RepID=A0A6A6Z1Y5_9PEZI|nr:uncharacterized protein BDZ99DRAFT_379763 [Mytilinidion resinicola]KAF2814304.1 hypothetical protein BDZ99DRAFT_379763 [Mytilinidion resinicola]